jgi:hypothetical protein
MMIPTTAPTAHLVASTADLRNLAGRASVHRFTRQLDPAALDQLDADGLHLLIPVLEPDAPAGRHATFVRCLVLLKFVGEPDPVMGLMDVATPELRALSGAAAPGRPLPRARSAGRPGRAPVQRPSPSPRQPARG